MRLIGLAVVAVALLGVNGHAGEEAPLDPSYGANHPVLQIDGLPSLDGFRWDERPAASDLAKLLEIQTPVKSQGKRGTCSIFSATAFQESLLKMHYKKEFDLAENYLEFLVQAKVKSWPSSGSDTDKNIPGMMNYGAIEDTTWPYEEYDWAASDLPESEKARRDATCAELTGHRREVCVMTHLDPHKDVYATDAAKFRAQWDTYRLWYTGLGTQKQIRDLLDSGYPVLFSVEFFYGAWNHRKMEEYGIGPRDMEKWGRGEVGVPTQKDIQLSRQHPAGHSIVIVGYDDAKRVYYFKNSWGLGNFGVTSNLLGEKTSDGYGSIAYDYAHYYGTFYDVYYRDDKGYPMRRK